jgi:hypothetical protein
MTRRGIGMERFVQVSITFLFYKCFIVFMCSNAYSIYSNSILFWTGREIETPTLIILSLQYPSLALQTLFLKMELATSIVLVQLR